MKDGTARSRLLEDEPTRAEAWLVLCEMAKVYAEIDAFVATHGTRKA